MIKFKKNKKNNLEYKLTPNFKLQKNLVKYKVWDNQSMRIVILFIKKREIKLYLKTIEIMGTIFVINCYRNSCHIWRFINRTRNRSI